MSEMTAIRTGFPWPRLARLATIAILAALWFLAASLLWRTNVPSNLDVSGLDPRRYFSPHELARAASFERFLRIDWVLSTLASLAALAVIAWRAPGIVRGIGIGRIGKGLIVGMVTLTAVWFATVPFSLAAWWWERRHGIAEGNIADWFTPQLPTLASGAAFSALAILFVMALGGRFPRAWWVPAAVAFTALGLLFTFVVPYLETLGAHRIERPGLRAQATEIAVRAGAAGTPVYVQDVSDSTTAANAMAEGLGPSRRVVLWSTILDQRFTDAEVRVVLAHEFTHIARRHLWKSVAWFGLFALPGTFLIALATRRRGGVGEPATVPLALLVILVLQLLSTPVTNVISRRYEAEADWGALRTTRDPAAARALFQSFSSTSLQQPDPPTWDYLLLETHPTLAQRIAMANAWSARSK